MRRRRFHITYQQAQVTILALENLITDIDQNGQMVNIQTWRLTKIEAQMLKNQLENFTWEVDT